MTGTYTKQAREVEGRVENFNLLRCLDKFNNYLYYIIYYNIMLLYYILFIFVTFVFITFLVGYNV